MDEKIIEMFTEIRDLLAKSAVQKEIYTVEEFSEITSIKKRRIYELVHIKDFPCTKDERKIYIHKEAIEWIKDREEIC